MKKFVLLIIIGGLFVQLLQAQSLAQLEAEGVELNPSSQNTIQPIQSGLEGIDEIPPGGLILIPESSGDRVIALDPETGDVVDEYFIDGSTGGYFSTPIKVIQSLDKTRLYVSDQVADVVHEFDNDGNYIGIFAPSSGPNPGVLDNVRGFCYRNGTDHILVSDGNNDVVAEFDGTGAPSGYFTSPGLVDPFDIIYWQVNDQYLVCDISGGDDADAVKVFDNGGNFLYDLIPNIDFPEQVTIAPGGNILVATFTSPSGIYEYAPDGTFVGYYDVVTSCRGVYELPNGNMLVTSGDAVYEVSKSNTIVSIKYQPGSASMRFITYVAPAGVNVTFQVDMSQQTVAPEGVHIAGSFQGWDPGATAMTNAGDGIYTYTHTFSGGESIEYKFVNGDEWGEDESVPAACAQNNNRYMTVPSVDTLLPAVCFGSCDPCGTPTEVTFQVDMSEQTVSPDGVHVAGSFQGWNPGSTEMLPIGDDVYAVTVSVSEGDFLEFKYINGNDWPGEEIVPAACGVPNGVGGYNRFYEVPVGGGTLEVVCFGSCYPCGVTPTEVDVTFRVDMSEQTVSPDGVHIAGAFQGWDPASDEMILVEDNIYEITFTLWAGDHHQYKFINGMTWDDEETVPAECGEDNGQGGYNRYIDVPDVDTILPAFCFSSCDPCGIIPNEIIVSFRVDMADEVVAAEGVHLAGSFQGWDPGATPMMLIEDAVYGVDVTLNEGYHYQYKFINGNTWEGEEIVPEECGEDNGQGGYNRYIDVPSMDTTLVTLCFSSCDTCVNTSIDQYDLLMDNLSLSPNPFEDELMLLFTGREEIYIEATLINALGSVLASRENVFHQSGDFMSLTGLESLPKGIYFLNIKVLNGGSSKQAMKKLIKN
jgi:hypothetical protein